MSTMRATLMQAAAAKLVADQATTVLTSCKEALMEFLDPGDSKHATPIDARDCDCLTVSVSKVTSKWAVKDEKLFLAWMKKHRPDSIIETVRASDQAAVLADIDSGRLNGEVPDGVEAVTGGGKMSVSQTSTQAANLRSLLQDGDVLELLTDLFPDAVARTVEPPPAPRAVA